METTDIPNYKTETDSGSYVHAVLNPKANEFRDMVSKSKYSILEIGCGSPPRLSWKLVQGDIWIGCDPDIKEGNDSILVLKSESQPGPNTKLVVFSDIADEIPEIKPDTLIFVAPNPKDICDDKIFNDDLTKFLDQGKKQYAAVALDNRTTEALGYGEEAMEKVLDWMKENNFIQIEKNTLLERFEPNSADLESENESMFFVKNLKSSAK